jgi:hypothetical protein
MKKVALCISGHARTLLHAFPQSLEAIKSSNENCEIDIYAALWGGSDGRIAKINDPHHYVANMVNPPNLLNHDYLKNWFLSLNVSSAKVELLDNSQMPSLLEIGKMFIGNVDCHLMPQYFSTKFCFDMVPDYEYTHIVRIRPDIVINNFPSLELLKSDLVTNVDAWYNDKAYQGFENEMIWIATQNVAKESASIHNRIIARVHPAGPTHGEAMTGRHFACMNCSKTRFNFDYRVAR